MITPGMCLKAYTQCYLYHANQRENLRMTEFERGCIRLIASCVLAFNCFQNRLIAIHVKIEGLSSDTVKSRKLEPTVYGISPAWFLLAMEINETGS